MYYGIYNETYKILFILTGALFMKRNKLVVLSVDALLWEDLYIARNYPGFSRIMKQHCGVEQVLSVYPTQTYPIHVVQATGQNMMDSGV